MTAATTETEGMESGRSLSLRPLALWLLAAGMAIGAVALLRFGVGSDKIFDNAVHMPWIVLALAFALFEMHSLNLRFRGETHTFNLNEIALVVGLLVISPWHLLVAELIGSGLVLGYRRLPPLKLAFNIGQSALAIVAATMVFRAIADPAHPLGPRTWLAAVLALSVSALIALAAITFAIAVTQGRVPVASIVRSFVFGLAGTAVNTMLGLVVAIVLDASMLAGVLLAGPILIVFVAYRAYLSEHSKSEGLQFLYKASELLSGARDLEGGLVALLDFARETFHAEIAEVVLRGDADEAIGYRTCAGPGDQTFRLEPVALDHVGAILAVAGDSGDVVLHRPTPGSELATVDGIAVHSMLVATLADENGVRGGVLVARPNGGTAQAFDKDEVRLFETFANHLGTTMEKSRLSTSLAQLRALKQELAHQAYHDSLTGLANRLKFRDLVDTALVEAARDGGKAAVMFIDLDDFKTVNDTMGHAAGDTLLETVANRISSSVGEFGTAARLGGDEFAVLMPARRQRLRGTRLRRPHPRCARRPGDDRGSVGDRSSEYRYREPCGCRRRRRADAARRRRHVHRQAKR